MGLRQRAFDQGIQNILGGLQGFADIEREKQRKEELQQQNKRARALQSTQFKFQVADKLGRELTPEEDTGIDELYQAGDTEGLSSILGDVGKISRAKKEESALDKQLSRQLTQAKITSLTEGKKKEKISNINKRITGLRKEVSGLPASKNLDLVSTAVKKVINAGKRKTAAGDMGMIFGFMKVVDPGSTVREGEFATAQNAAGWPERMRNLYNRALEGTRLEEKQRADFIDTAITQADAQLSSFQRAIKPIRRTVEVEGLPPEQIFPPTPDFRSGLSQPVDNAGQVKNLQQEKEELLREKMLLEQRLTNRVR